MPVPSVQNGAAELPATPTTVPAIEAPAIDAAGPAGEAFADGCVGTGPLLSPPQAAAPAVAAANAAVTTTLVMVRMSLLVNSVAYTANRSVFQRAHAWPTGLTPDMATEMPVV